MTGGVRHERPRVRGLGYVVVESRDIEGWRRFGTELLGLQEGDSPEGGLRLRMDEKAYRLAVVPGGGEGVTAVGWEVAGPDELAALESTLEERGFAPARMSAEDCRTRGVTAAVTVADPDGQYVCELHYGLEESNDVFVSPTGAEFVVGPTVGIGHVFQAVADEAPYQELYLDVLGFELTDHIEVGGRDLSFTHCNRRHHTFAFAHLPERGVGVGHLMVELTDLDMLGRAMEKVDAGTAPLRSTFGRHTNDKMLSIYVESPSGFHVEIGHGGRLVTDEWIPGRFTKTAYWGHRKVTDHPADESRRTA